MNKAELLEYITNRKYMCELCFGLQRKIVEGGGLQAIKDYEGFICPSIEDMKIRLYDVTE